LDAVVAWQAAAERRRQRLTESQVVLAQSQTATDAANTEMGTRRLERIGETTGLQKRLRELSISIAKKQQGKRNGRSNG
jgi:hypothetical protein